MTSTQPIHITFLNGADVEKILFADTVPLHDKKIQRLEVCSVAQLLARLVEHFAQRHDHFFQMGGQGLERFGRQGGQQVVLLGRVHQLGGYLVHRGHYLFSTISMPMPR